MAEMNESKKEILREKYMEYIKEDVLPRAQSRLIDELAKGDPDMKRTALEYMRTCEWSKSTRFVYEWYFNSRLEMLWKKTERLMRSTEKKITVLAVISTVISVSCLIAMICMSL
ncbi:MAG: hypothetical protein HFH88_10255 [Lachnospiraceae bacterium]|nr:hypothetical protein [Lachnospiraceae bacterium]